MFTGIVEELGKVRAIDMLDDSARIEVQGPLAAGDSRHGDSIAVNGCCLTVVELGAEGSFVADVMHETLKRTNLGQLEPGDPVNLERPMRADGRLGGHMVQGHVDTTAAILAREPAEHWELVRVALPPGFAQYVVAQGSIAVDGVSLTVVDVADDQFGVSLIPATLALTTLGTKAVGTVVNLEFDIIGKYVERLVKVQAAAQPTTSQETV